jgi:diguanylate cyclase (GGDEF)-like protein
MNTPQPGITQLNADLAESLRDGHFVSLVLFYIDHFHQINADLGEAAGDAILALVGEILADIIPVSYRIGGDSHAVLGLTPESADELRGAVKLVASQRLQAHVSLSGGGISIVPDLLAASEETERLLYAAASQMLALAKQGGRDEIVWLTDDGPFEGETGVAALHLFRDLARVNASRARQMEVESKVDPLTGLFNRRGFDDIFSRMVDSSQRTERPLGLLYMDSDSLKSINDRDGH